MLIVAALLLYAFHVGPRSAVLALLISAVALELLEKSVLVWTTRRIPVAVGPETMIGRRVKVISACRPAGRVRIGAESWKARCADGADVGELLVVEAVDDVTLLVGRARS
ncbi:MAG TPA: NfeD family protein [Gaiellaceae bacterium]|jgi:membrane protein implicated in regulation of membrane protease activity|nr:NfeD family protein [Gaiellaceae bacterium]